MRRRFGFTGFGINGGMQRAGGTPTPTPTPTPSNEIPVTFGMFEPRFLFNAATANSMLKTDASPATVAGDAVETLVDSSGNTRNAASAANGNGASTSATRGALGGSGTELTVGGSPVYPLVVGNSNQTNRYNTPASTYTMASGAVGDKLVFFGKILPPASAADRGVFGSSSGNFNIHLEISDSATRGLVSTGSTAGSIKTDTTDRYELIVQGKKAASQSNYYVWVDGSEVTNSVAGAGFSAASTSRLSIGNFYGTGSGAHLHVFVAMVVAEVIAQHRGLMQMLEGLIAHTYGQAALLPVGHPYKTTAPTVPSGTTTLNGYSAGNFADPVNIFEGAIVQIENRAFNDPAAAVTRDGNLLVEAVGGCIQEANPTWRAWLAARFGHGYGFRYIRWSDHNHQGGSYTAAGKDILPHWTTSPVGNQLTNSEDQDQQIANFIAATGKAINIIYGQWTPPPYFKSTATLHSAGAGDGGTWSYPDPVGSPAAYATWCAEYVTQFVNRMADLDAKGFRIKRVAVAPNETGNPSKEQYGKVNVLTTRANDIPTLVKLAEDIITAVDAATWINTTAASIGYTFQGWDGPSGVGGTEMQASAKVNRITQWTTHDIALLDANADGMSTYTASNGARTSFDETGIFDRSGLTEAQLAANLMLWFANAQERNSSAFHMPMIHLAKPTYGGAYNLDNAMMLYKSSRNTSDTTGYSAASGLSAGEFCEIAHIWYPAKSIIESLPWDTQRYRVNGYPTTGAGRSIVNFISPTGKMIVLFVNKNASVWNPKHVIGPNRAFNIKTYSATDSGSALTAVNVSVLTPTVAANTWQWWVEQ